MNVGQLKKGRGKKKKNRCKKGRKVSNKMFGLPEVVFRVGLVSCAQV